MIWSYVLKIIVLTMLPLIIIASYYHCFLFNIINSKVTSFPLADLLPEELDGFYLYNGSLTEPNHCPEVVQVLDTCFLHFLGQFLHFYGTQSPNTTQRLFIYEISPVFIYSISQLMMLNIDSG